MRRGSTVIDDFPQAASALEDALLATSAFLRAGDQQKINDAAIAVALEIFNKHECPSRSEAMRKVLLWAQERFRR